MWVAERIGCEDRLEATIVRMQLKYTGQVLRHASLEKDIQMGTIPGSRSRGGPRKTWSGIKEVTGRSASSLLRLAQDREE